MNRRIYKLRIMHIKPLVLATALLTSVSVFAQTEISTEAQLKAIANNLSGTYVLTQDITLSDDEWTPIGTKDSPFTGTLDGQGHTIIGLTVGNGVQNQTNNNKAFFGFTNGATVTNIAFTNAVVKGYEQAAIVVAQATSSTLNNIYVSGVVTGRDHVGTIAGDARGTTGKRTQITNCVSTAAALSTEHQGGGIAGWTNNSIFSYNIAYGAVTAPIDGAGGITGMVDDEGSSEYTSNISAATYIKGDNNKTHGINGWCNNKCSNTGRNNLSWAGTEYNVGGSTKKATKITEPSNGSGIHGTVTSTEDLKKVATYTGLGFNTNTWTLEEGKLPQLKQFSKISDAVSISGLPGIITLGQTVTATSALNRPITITSSDHSIISVNGNTLKAENYGTCNITITTPSGDFAEGANKTFTITVPNSLQVTYQIGDAAAVTSEVSTEGNLVTLLGDNAMKVTQLSVNGYLNNEDIGLLKKMAGQTKETDSEVTGSLKSLNLSEATFMSTGKKVPDNIFQNCKNLQHVYLSNMTEIGKWAFNNCALTEITIPASVTIIQEEAFKGCSALNTLKFEAGTPESEKELVLKEGAFFGCGNMDLADDGVLPSRIISIADHTFEQCGITKLTLPTNEKLTGITRKLDFNGVQTDNMGALGYGVFFGCSKLTDLTIPANVTVINEVAFQNCNLQNVTFADATKITKIQNYAFTNNQNLAGIFADKDFVHLETIGKGAFQNCFKLTDADFKNLTKNVTRIENETFRNCHEGLKIIDIHSGITFIGAGAFADNTAVTKVIVHRGTQIDAQSYDGDQGIFYRMEPNNVQVEFQGDAESNYKVYRENINVDGVDKGKNAFMFLLTKTLDEDATDYTVVAQRHADVLLKRTFKEGWNTLVLPFGARDNGETVKYARIYQKALHTTDTDGFMIAAYRGLSKNNGDSDNSTFYFLQYADYDKDPLDECEPLLIKMTQKDIDDAKGVYTFKNVELNYDGDNGKTYTADEMIARMGKKEDGKYFTGNYNHENNDKFGKCTYDDFYFTGTLYKQTGIATEGSAFIAPGDYIIQNNTFVKCFPNKTYGLKGFRGYFKQKKPSGGTSGGQSGAKGIGICLVDRNGVVSSIHQVDGVSLTSASVAPVAVYNLSGQQVGNSLSTLAKGVYIVNGKKFVKK